MKGKAGWSIAVIVLAGSGSLTAAAAEQGQKPGAPPSLKLGPTARRGEYLVRIGGCNDCHTPWEMGSQGPAPDMSRMLSGHPEQPELPTAPALPSGPWSVTMTATHTAFSGPWGTSFTANLTPDKETGLGNWTERNFLEAMRNGRHLGRGRLILPPMPWFNLAPATDSDLKAIWAYLRSIPAIRNRVPDPLPDVAAASAAPGPAGTR